MLLGLILFVSGGTHTGCVFQAVVCSLSLSAIDLVTSSNLHWPLCLICHQMMNNPELMRTIMQAHPGIREVSMCVGVRSGFDLPADEFVQNFRPGHSCACSLAVVIDAALLFLPFFPPAAY
jgi:hypothetical protein